jgi:hypothetical protein
MGECRGRFGKGWFDPSADSEHSAGDGRFSQWGDSSTVSGIFCAGDFLYNEPWSIGFWQFRIVDSGSVGDCRPGHDEREAKLMPMKRTVRKRVSKAITKFVRGKNPTKRSTRKRVSRSLTKFVRNFTGTITRTGDGQVVIAGTGPKPMAARNPRRKQTFSAWGQDGKRLKLLYATTLKAAQAQARKLWSPRELRFVKKGTGEFD